ncbi:MAG TPA: metallophosphoesterase family protein [Bacillales bacterium]|nr:metallophosphoesterase family protein [Bacillales bacterium]
MNRTLAISDIHGELEKFERLLEKISYDPSEDQLILLGDYIDRGPQSMAVVDKVMKLEAEGAIALKGNHDDMMEKAFEDESQIKRWLRNGGMQTLESYDYTVPDAETEDLDSLITKMTPLTETEEVERHLSFFRNLDHYHETEDYIFVHGGVHPTMPLPSTDPNVLMWIREEFHYDYNGKKKVIFGHTPTNTFQDGFEVYFGDNNIIGIDGGCVFGGQLNALELPSGKVYFVE